MILYSGVYAKQKDHKEAIIIDFDDTLAEDAYPDIGKPLTGAKEALEALKEAGYEIIISSCRTTTGDGKPIGEASKQHKKMEDWLKENDIPFDRVDDGKHGKPHGIAMIDNKALNYGGKSDDWEKLAKFLISGGRP